MNIADLITRDRVLLDVDVTCAKQAFRLAAEKIVSITSLENREVIDALVERERLGSTGVGEGVSVPHARFEKLTEVVGLFMRLRHTIDMDAVDEKPIKLMFVVLAPIHANTEHLKVLSRVARILRSPANKQLLTESTDRNAVYDVLISEDQ
jgi:PTS system nitrogen regulatory IIA component